MGDVVSFTDAVEHAAAELGPDVVAQPVDTVDASPGNAAPPDPPPPVTADAQGQGELFPPPPPAPFDFEKAYEDLARIDIRARNKKRAWEACKRETADARKAYDEALDDLHNLFIQIDQERRHARGTLNQSAAMGVAFAAAVAAEQQHDTTTEGGEDVSDMESTIDETPDAGAPTEACDPPTEAPPADEPQEGPRD